MKYDVYLVRETHESVNEGRRVGVRSNEIGSQWQAGHQHDRAANKIVDSLIECRIVLLKS